MKITVTRPTAEHRIVTDMDALAESVRLGNRIIEIDRSEPATESEASDLRAEREAVHEKLAGILDEIDRTTIVATLRGLSSSQWAQITVKHSKAAGDRVVRDLPAIAAEAAPLMLEHAAWADGRDADITPKEFAGLIETMTDSQVNDLMRQVQDLNTPVTEVPKAVTRLL